MAEGKFIKLSVSKLIGLWAFSECTLGGILHAFQIPFSGLLLGGVAVTVVCCIGFTAERPASAILYGTLVAMSVKFALSPHTPVTAYLAVGFQGVLGALIFSFQRRLYLFYLIYGALALAESALQKLLTLTIIFGNTLWDSLSATSRHVAGLLGFSSDFPYGNAILIIYTLVYIVWGCVIGHWAYSIPSGIERLSKSDIISTTPLTVTSGRKRKKGKWLLGVAMVLILFTAIYIFHLSGINLVRLILRPIIIIVIWWAVFNPLLKFLLAKLLQRKNNNVAVWIAQIKEDIPQMRLLSMKAAAYVRRHYKGPEKIRHFILILILLSCEENSHLA
ncbi:MAG: hypothetical protein J5I59_07340 [Saprospiraceae bacterium]|nr:hypothetical protein [Saprospiraceae bacterium]